MAEHQLKTWPTFFRAVACGSKTFEVRKDDRAFDVGDVLILREWDPGAFGRSLFRGGDYTGQAMRVRVTYVLRGGDFGIAPGHVVMAIAPEVDDGG